MPRITQFKSPQQSLNVRGVNLSTAGVGAKGRALQEMGGVLEKTVSHSLQQLKTARDNIAVSNKTLAYRDKWFEIEKDLKLKRLEDGTMNPVNYPMDGDKPQRYSDVAFKELDTLTKDMIGSSENIEIETAFAQKANSYRNQWNITANHEERQLEVTFASESIDKESDNLSRKMLAKELTNKDLQNLTETFFEIQEKAVRMQTSGYFDKRTLAAKNAKIQHKFARSIADNFVMYKQWTKLEAFIKSGGLIPGVDGKPLDELDQETIENSEDLVEGDIEVLKARNLTKAQVIELESKNPLYLVSQNLSDGEAREYLKKAFKGGTADLADQHGYFRRNLNSLKQLQFEGFENVGDLAETTDFLRRYTSQMYKGPKSKEGALIMTDINMALIAKATVERLALLSPSERKKQMKFLDDAPAQALEMTARDYPQFKKDIAQVKNSFAARGTVQPLIKIARSALKRLDKEMVSSPASYSFNHFPEVRAAFKHGMQKGDMSGYIRELTRQSTRLGVPRNRIDVVPTHVQNQFIKDYNAANPDEQAQILVDNKNSWGANWNRASLEYLKNKKIPFEARIASMFTDRGSMVTMLSVLNDKKSKAINTEFNNKFTNQAKRNLFKMKKELASDDYMEKFRRAVNFTAAFRGDSAQVNTTIDKAILRLAQKSMTDGKDYDDAIEESIKMITKANYKVASTDKTAVFVSNTAPVRLNRLQSFLDVVDDAEEFAKLDTQISMRTDQVTKALGKTGLRKDAAKMKRKNWNEFLEDNAQWQTSRDGKGLTLYVFDPKTNVRTPVYKNGTTKPITVNWGAINTHSAVAKDLKPFFGGN